MDGPHRYANVSWRSEVPGSGGTSVTPQSLLPKQTGLGAETDRSFSLLCGIGSVDVPVHYSKDHVTQSAITKARRSDCWKGIRSEWPT